MCTASTNGPATAPNSAVFARVPPDGIAPPTFPSAPSLPDARRAGHREDCARFLRCGGSEHRGAAAKAACERLCLPPKHSVEETKRRSTENTCCVSVIFDVPHLPLSMHVDQLRRAAPGATSVPLSVSIRILTVNQILPVPLKRDPSKDLGLRQTARNAQAMLVLQASKPPSLSHLGPKVFSQSFCRNQLPRKSVNASLTLTKKNNMSTDLYHARV